MLCSDSPENHSKRRVIPLVIKFITLWPNIKTFSGVPVGVNITVAKTAEENEANSGSHCALFQGQISASPRRPITIRCRVPLVGRFVRVTDTTGYNIFMCEFEVYTKVTG